MTERIIKTVETVERTVVIVYDDGYCGNRDNAYECPHFEFNNSMAYQIDGCKLFDGARYLKYELNPMTHRPREKRLRCRACLEATGDLEE